jgi:hypothetical protein
MALVHESPQKVEHLIQVLLRHRAAALQPLADLTQNPQQDQHGLVFALQVIGGAHR